jgi:hypothetical protein
MTARNVRIGLTLCVLLTLRPARAEDSPRPERERLRSEVFLLASPEFAGRRHDGGEKTAAHLVQAFRKLGLEPLFGGDYVQPIPPAEPGRIQGRNVGARLIGTDATKRDEWVIVSAHFDHLGVRNGVLYPGADDNASGVAMMLEVARAIVQSKEKPRRSLMFIGFDLEEVGLYGSRYFVEHSPVPLSRVALFLTADMIGRSLGGVCGPYVFVMGSEHAPGLRPWLDEAAGHKPINLGVLGSDVLLLDRSDYGPFRTRRIPYLFFSTGENPCYHTPNDTAGTVDYPKLEAISRLIHEVVRKAVSADSVPVWNPAPDNPIAEAVTVRSILRTLLENRENLKIGTAQSYMMTNTLRRLDAIIARGSITPAERSGMVNVARIVLLSVL